MSKGRNMSEFYPDVVKNVIVSIWTVEMLLQGSQFLAG
jgi:hypothetical protein